MTKIHTTRTAAQHQQSGMHTIIFPFDIVIIVIVTLCARHHKHYENQKQIRTNGRTAR